MTAYETLFSFPARRDVAGMSQLFGMCSEGQTVAIGIDSPRYGAYFMQGAVRITSGDEIVVAGSQLASKIVMKNDLQVRQPVKEVRAVMLEDLPPLDGKPVEVSSLSHGDLVSAEFEQHPYGYFRILGVLTAQEGSDNLALGPWFVREGGAQARRVLSLERILSKGEHTLKVPGLRATNFSSDEQ